MFWLLAMFFFFSLFTHSLKCCFLSSSGLVLLILYPCLSLQSCPCVFCPNLAPVEKSIFMFRSTLPATHWHTTPALCDCRENILVEASVFKSYLWIVFQLQHGEEQGQKQPKATMLETWLDVFQYHHPFSLTADTDCKGMKWCGLVDRLLLRGLGGG